LTSRPFSPSLSLFNQVQPHLRHHPVLTWRLSLPSLTQLLLLRLHLRLRLSLLPYMFLSLPPRPNRRLLWPRHRKRRNL
jgi:hypothetical protein